MPAKSKPTTLGRYRLKTGSHNNLEPGAVIEHERDLAAEEPERWELVDGPAPEPAVPQNAAVSSPPEKPGKPGNLESMTINQLREHAEAEEIDLGGASDRGEIIKAIRGT